MAGKYLDLFIKRLVTSVAENTPESWGYLDDGDTAEYLVQILGPMGLFERKLLAEVSVDEKRQFLYLQFYHTTKTQKEMILDALSKNTTKLPVIQI